MKISQMVSFVAPLLLIFCSTPQKKAETEDDGIKDNFQKQIEHNKIHIPPGQCRISGTIVAVDEQHATQETDDPCSKAPCTATVRVDSIYGFGSGFAGSVATGGLLDVRFPFTLGSTELLGINIEKHLPGLTKGDRFNADLESRPVFGGTVQYSIYTYEKK